MPWFDVYDGAELERRGTALTRVDGRHVMLVRTSGGIAAFPNRCPHEGYPLAEGDLCGETLRCNWHNWTFDLQSGKALAGGDGLRMLPAKLVGGRVFLLVEPRDVAVETKVVLGGVIEALDEADEQRLVREAARLMRLASDPVETVRVALPWVAERLKYGTTHAIGGAADWLTLFDADGLAADRRLAALGEVLGHIADDGRRERRFPFASASAPWSEAEFLLAIERQGEDAAVARLRGALAAGLTFAELTPVFARAALAHYAGFGHSVIYTHKTRELIARLGPSSLETAALLLTRSLIVATREDLLPEFRSYAEALAAWGSASEPPELAAPLGGSARAAMAQVAEWSARYEPERIFRRLVDEAARTLLEVDEFAFFETDTKLAESVGWLDFTHAITFAEAGAALASETPELWPAVLLQLACFVGRSARYRGPARDVPLPGAAAAARFFAHPEDVVIDHGRDRFIISVHLIKTFFAGRRLAERERADPALQAAAIGRFIDARMKGRHVLRTARQMLDLVAGE